MKAFPVSTTTNSSPKILKIFLLNVSIFVKILIFAEVINF